MPSSRFLLAASSLSPHLRLASASVPLRFPTPSPCRCPCFPASSPLSSPHLFPSSLSRAFLLVFPLHLLRTFPRCLLIFLASSFFLPSQPPPASFLSAFPRLLLAASTSTPVSSPLRFPSPSGNSSLLRLGAFPLTGILFVLFLVRGIVEERAHLLGRQGGGCLPAFAGY